MGRRGTGSPADASTGGPPVAGRGGRAALPRAPETLEDAPTPSDPTAGGSDADGADLTPMMRQYRDWKRRYPDYLLLFRLGDFFELFFEDAVAAARTLGIALTSRQKGEGAIPMAGVPHHAAEGHIARLIRAGHKVALCDQVESPAARGRKLLRREVIRLITPGTVTELGLLDGQTHNFLAALVRLGDRLGAALVDITTADFWVGESRDQPRLAEAVLLRRPAEVLVSASLGAEDPLVARFREEGIAVTVRDAASFAAGAAEERLRAHFRVAAVEALGLGGQPAAVRAAGAVLGYLAETQRGSPTHLTRVQPLDLDAHLILDEAAVRNLELVEGLQGRGRPGSLLWALDRTMTPMGGRLLRQWILRPLRDVGEIGRRLDAVEALAAGPATLEALRGGLGPVGDLARLASRVALGVATPRDLAALRASLRALGPLAGLLPRIDAALVAEAVAGVEDLEPTRARLDTALVDDPPLSAHEGGIVRESYHEPLATLRREVQAARAWIAGLEATERARTGIPSLRVRFNRVFGYGIEVSKPHTHLVPDDYVRRQTLVGAERYVTAELKEQEGRVLGAEERTNRLELELFEELRRAVAVEADRMLEVARGVAVLDVLAGLAEVARDRGWVRPLVDPSGVLEIGEGRHPVLELRSDSPFVPNDLRLDGREVDCLVITGRGTPARRATCRP